MEHSSNLNVNEALHSWNVTMDVYSSTKNNWFNIIGNLERTSKIDTRDWKVSGIICRK